MIHIHVLLTVKDPAQTDTVRELLAQQRQLSLTEPGCIRFEVAQSQADPAVFILGEQWESEAALDAHREAKAFSEIYVPKIIPLVDRVPYLCSLVE